MGLAHRFISLIEVEKPGGSESGGATSHQFITSDDLLPVPREERTWTGFSYVAFWVSTSININTWMITSSMIQLGMSWWQAWICVWVGYTAATPFVVLNARPGAIFHVTFPVANRTSFGIFGSLWCVFNRAAMACIWYGVQSSVGGSCVLVMLRTMWPSVNNIPNSMPVSSGTNTRDFMCFFLFWLISLPFIWFPVHQIRHFFAFKTIIAPIACLAFMIWCIVKAKGVGPIVDQPGTIHGSNLGWAMVSGVMSCMSNMFYEEHSGMRLILALEHGIRQRQLIVSSSSQAIYGQTIWSPVDLLGMFLDDNPSGATRFGVWFIAFSFIIAQNIRRGGYISAIVGLAMCPWNLLKSSSSFTAYLNAYSVFLSAIAGVMAAEYWLVRKGHYNVADLYVARKGSWYWYWYGFNPRGYAAYVAGITINVVGFVGDTGRVVPAAATHIYDLSFFTGFGTSAIVYWALNRIWPPYGVPSKFEEVDVSRYEESHCGDAQAGSVETDSVGNGTSMGSEKA
ncbi:permease for cytosine/purines, uracil, thiamine, allantoin-domain-containing protein [Melanogaster broomeanus]|nr:permease for cytosine/purines, uracil, thiamine, allantoin-domain-containing protein [Melanogaster broomeanus]